MAECQSDAMESTALKLAKQFQRQVTCRRLSDKSNNHDTKPEARKIIRRLQNPWKNRRFCLIGVIHLSSGLVS